MDKLKACPCCGSKDIKLTTESSDDGVIIDYCSKIECTNCNLTRKIGVLAGNIERAQKMSIGMWNERSECD